MRRTSLWLNGNVTSYRYYPTLQPRVLILHENVALYTQQTYVGVGLQLGLGLVGVGLGSELGLGLWLTDMLCNCWVYDATRPYHNVCWCRHGSDTACKRDICSGAVLGGFAMKIQSTKWRARNFFTGFTFTMGYKTCTRPITGNF